MLKKLFTPIYRAKRAQRHACSPRLLAFLDFAFMPYALGDTLTYVENAQVSAVDAGVTEIEFVILATRERPAPSWQPFVTHNNFMAHLHGLMPVFLSSPMVRNVHLLENRQTFYAMVTDMRKRGTPTWPDTRALKEERIDFMSHLRIVDHYRRRGSIPLLGAPLGYAEQTKKFISSLCPDRFKIVINVRQSHLKAARANPERDSVFETWAEFIIQTAKKFSDVAFFVVGQYSDVDRRFSVLPNTLVPRQWGLGLGVELALLQEADLFMGTSSGFAQAALFGHPAYIVTNTEERAAPYCGVPAGARHHPFGRPDQIVTWSRETVESLEKNLEDVLATKVEQGGRVPTSRIQEA